MYIWPGQAAADDILDTLSRLTRLSVRVREYLRFTVGPSCVVTFRGRPPSRGPPLRLRQLAGHFCHDWHRGWRGRALKTVLHNIVKRPPVALMLSRRCGWEATQQGRRSALVERFRGPAGNSNVYTGGGLPLCRFLAGGGARPRVCVRGAQRSSASTACASLALRVCWTGHLRVQIGDTSRVACGVLPRRSIMVATPHLPSAWPP